MTPVHRLPRPVETHWDWQRHAACRGLDVEAFFHPDAERGPAREARAHAAKRVCAVCPVIERCREWAHRVQEPFGVWGGESEQERRSALAQDRRGSAG